MEQSRETREKRRLFLSDWMKRLYPPRQNLIAQIVGDTAVRNEPLFSLRSLDRWSRYEDSFALLADRKRETPVVATTAVATGWPEAAAGNLYIEEGSTMTPTRSKRSRIARIQRNIETILSHKTNQGTDWHNRLFNQTETWDSLDSLVCTLRYVLLARLLELNSH